MIVNPTLSHAAVLARQNWNAGHVLEFGVAAGTTCRQLVADFADTTAFQVFGFDSCVGLPEDWPGTVCKKGAFTNHGNDPYVPGLDKFYKGWFEDTVPQFLNDRESYVPIALLHLDADLYSSTITVLRGLNHLIAPGTVIVCDEWGIGEDQNCIEQERKAIWEWQEVFGRELEKIEVEDDSPCGPQRALFVVTV